MQTIGKMEDGRVLAVLTRAESAGVEAMLGLAADLLNEVSLVMNPSGPWPRPGRDAEIETALQSLGKVGTPARPKILKATPRSGARAEPKKPGSTPARKKNCAICGKQFTDDSRTNSRKTCKKASCREALAERGKAARKERQNKPKADSRSAVHAPAANPADPLLTDEERKAARLEIIRRSALRHADG